MAGSLFARDASLLQSHELFRLTPVEQWKTGGAFNATPVDISHFHANFTFEYTGSSDKGSADGIVFVIKNTSSAGSNSGLGGVGGAMGYGTTSGETTGNSATGIGQSVGIEFDNWQNNQYSDPDDNHIGIDVNGNVKSLATQNVSTSFENSGLWYAWVDYNGTTMTVTTGKSADKSGATVLSYGTSSNPFLIQSYVGASTGLVGFTAGTGLAAQNHVVKSFNYSPNPEPSTYVLMGVGALAAGVLGRKKIVGSAKC